MRQPNPSYRTILPAMPRLSLVVIGVVLTGALLTGMLPADGALAGEFEKRFTLDGNELTLANLIGEITLERAGGSQFEVEVFVRGDDADEDLIEFTVDEGRVCKLAIEFPIEDERRYVYPELGRNSNCTITVRRPRGDDDDRSFFRKIFGGIGKNRIKVSGRGSGLELWADVTIKVPEGKRVGVLHGAGEIFAADIEGDVRLDSRCGGISGRQLMGDILADTGSGGVDMEDIKGELTVDTGSGSVVVNGFTGDELSVDTGSGSVEVEEIACEALEIDTGSGGVDALDITADNVKIDTGSGGVELQLVEMGDGRFVVDTGSGSIEVTLPQDASVRVHADTGSGSVKADVDDADIGRKRRDEITFTVGDGDARMDLDAGSGSIRIRQR